jgi:Flp pilus assembly protein TadG
MQHSRQAGQTLVVLIIAMMTVLGMCALAIDAGYWYQTKCNLQAAADAGALAGASQPPVSNTAATGKAAAEYKKTGRSSDAVSVSVTTDLTTGDSVTVTASRTVGNWFARLFGQSTTTVTVTSRATIESFATIVPQQNVMPWAVMKGDYTPGSAYPIYTDNSHNANNGAISPPYVNGAACPVPNGANDYSNEIAGGENVCPISVGEPIDVKSGNNTGPTSQGLNTRITTWYPLGQLADTSTDPASILRPSSPQIVLIPVVTNLAGGTTWPNGSSAQIKVVGFAWFVITGCGPADNQTHCANSDGGQVDGIFLNMDLVDTSSTPGAWNGSQNTAYTIELTA